MNERVSERQPPAVPPASPVVAQLQALRLALMASLRQVDAALALAAAPGAMTAPSADDGDVPADDPSLVHGRRVFGGKVASVSTAPRPPRLPVAEAVAAALPSDTRPE